MEQSHAKKEDLLWHAQDNDFKVKVKMRNGSTVEGYVTSMGNGACRIVAPETTMGEAIKTDWQDLDFDMQHVEVIDGHNPTT
jgi:hypothetical protein